MFEILWVIPTSKHIKTSMFRHQFSSTLTFIHLHQRSSTVLFQDFWFRLRTTSHQLRCQRHAATAAAIGDEGQTWFLGCARDFSRFRLKTCKTLAPWWLFNGYSFCSFCGLKHCNLSNNWMSTGDGWEVDIQSLQKSRKGHVFLDQKIMVFMRYTYVVYITIFTTMIPSSYWENQGWARNGSGFWVWILGQDLVKVASAQSPCLPPMSVSSKPSHWTFNLKSSSWNHAKSWF